jgi:hypothetical protein
VCACSNLFALEDVFTRSINNIPQRARWKFACSNYLLSQFSNKPQCNKRCQLLRIIDFLDFSDISILPNSGIGQLCEDLNTIIEKAFVRYVLNSKYSVFMAGKWFITTINIGNVLCGTFGLYPGYVAGILNSVKEIIFYVLCNKHIRYGIHIRTCIAGRECTSKLVARNSFLLPSVSDTVLLSFEARLIHVQLLSGLIFAQIVLRKM